MPICVMNFFANPGLIDLFLTTICKQHQEQNMGVQTSACVTLTCFISLGSDSMLLLNVRTVSLSGGIFSS